MSTSRTWRPLYATYENSAYFDEIYHARTAYEHILNLEPYENTHPPLGKYLISLGIRLFGMNPFGWRCVGTFFGVLMLPALYYLIKKLLGSTWLCALGTLLFAFDFMHFTQTRIATIDTYAVFFLLLMYGAMAAFLRRDLLRDSWKQLLPPLLLCGVFTGLVYVYLFSPPSGPPPTGPWAWRRCTLASCTTPGAPPAPPGRTPALCC